MHGGGDDEIFFAVVKNSGFASCVGEWHYKLLRKSGTRAGATSTMRVHDQLPVVHAP